MSEAELERLERAVAVGRYMTVWLERRSYLCNLHIRIADDERRVWASTTLDEREIEQLHAILNAVIEPARRMLKERGD